MFQQNLRKSGGWGGIGDELQVGSGSCALRTPGGPTRNCETAAKDWLQKGMRVLEILKHRGLTVCRERRQRGEKPQR